MLRRPMSRTHLQDGDRLSPGTGLCRFDQTHGQARRRRTAYRRALMNRHSLWRTCILITALACALLSWAAGQATSGQVATTQITSSSTALAMTRFLAFCPNAITQDFPTSGAAQTTWLICWHEVAGEDSVADPIGLIIGPVYFRKSPDAPMIRVLWDLRVSDYFVPYHPGDKRYYDLSHYNFKLTSVLAADCPATVVGT